MKGLIAKTVCALGLTGGLALTQGCLTYRDIVDPCYPWRYDAVATQEVYGAYAPQMRNGHVLDQTVYNSDFEVGTGRLTEGGREHLLYLVRRRPAPDTVVYVQIAQDIPYDQAAPEKFVEARNQLNQARVSAVQKYLNAQTAGLGVAFTVVLHDPPEVGISAVPQGLATQQMNLSSQGTLKLYNTTRTGP